MTAPNQVLCKHRGNDVVRRLVGRHTVDGPEVLLDVHRHPVPHRRVGRIRPEPQRSGHVIAQRVRDDGHRRTGSDGVRGDNGERLRLAGDHHDATEHVN